MDGGRLLVSYREERAKLNGYLDDYAFLARGLLDLYEACLRAARFSRQAETTRLDDATGTVSRINGTAVSSSPREGSRGSC